VAKAPDRFSIHKRVKVVHEDEPADLEAAERLFARLCVRMLLAEQRTGQRSEEGSPSTEDNEPTGPISEGE